MNAELQSYSEAVATVTDVDIHILLLVVLYPYQPGYSLTALKSLDHNDKAN